MVDDFFKYRYGWEKFHGAVHSLAGHGTLHERLENAYTFHIINLDCDQHIPEPVQERFNGLKAMMTSADVLDGRVRATVQAMDDGELSRAVEMIIGIYDDICRYMPRH